MGAQKPLLQVVPPTQKTSHPPQFALSVLGLTHPELHSIRPGPQLLWLQVPPLQAVPSGQMASH